MTLRMENQLDKLSNILKCMQKCLECVICLETITVPVQTKCGHLFCNNCIMAVAIKKGAVCPLCKEPISRRSIFIDTQAKELRAGFEALFDAILADTGTDIRNHVSKPGNEREGIRTPCKSPIEQKNIRTNATKSHLLRNAKKNKAAAGPINLNESAKPIKDSENIQNNTRLESSDGHDVDHVNKNKNSNIASIKYMEILKGIDHTHESAPRKKVAAWLESMERAEELETIEAEHNSPRNTDMPSKRCLPCTAYTLDQLNKEGNPCTSNIDKIISDENKILSSSSAEADEFSKKTNNLLPVTMDVINGTVKSLSDESDVITSKISEIGADKFANQNLKYKGVHLRVQEINKKLLNTSANDNWSRVMQFGNHNNTVNTTLSPYSYANNQRMKKNTLSKSRDTISEDTEGSKVMDDVSSLKSSDRHNSSGDTDGSTVIMSNISYTPIVSSGGVGNTTGHSLSKTNVNNNGGLHSFEKTTAELKVMSLSNSYVNQLEISSTQNDQRIDPDDKMHNDSLIHRDLQLVSKDIKCVSTKNMTAKEACVNESYVSNQAMTVLSPIPNFREQLVRHFGSPSRIERGQQREYDCTLQDVTLRPPKLTRVKGRSLSQQMDLNDAKSNPNEFLVESNGSPFSSSIPNIRNKLYQKGTLRASNNPDISQNVEVFSTSTLRIAAGSRKTVNSAVNLEYAETVGKYKHGNSQSSSYSTKSTAISSQKFREKFKSKRITTQKQNENNTIKKCIRNIQFFYMGHLNSRILKAQITPFNDIAIQSGTVTHTRQTQTSPRISELNMIEEQKLIIEKQRLIMAKQELAIKNQEIIINKQKLTIKEQEQTISKQYFSERNVEFSNKSLSSKSQIPLKSSSVSLQVGTTMNETFGQNETQKQNSSASTSTNMKSINASFHNQSILIHPDSDNERDNTCIKQEKNVLEKKNISKSGCTNYINSQERQNCSMDMCHDYEKKIKDEPRVAETPLKNTIVKHNDLSCDSPRTQQLAEEHIVGSDIPNTKLSYTTDYETSVKGSISQESRLTYKRIIAKDSPNTDSDPLEVSLPLKNPVDIETCSKTYNGFKSEKILKNNFSDIVMSHKKTLPIDRKRSTSSLIQDETNVDAIMDDWCSSSKLSGLNNKKNNNSNRKRMSNIISRDIKQIERSIDMAWKNTKMCQVDDSVDTCYDRETSLLTKNKDIAPSTNIRCDEKFTPKTDESREEVRTKKRKLSETEGCVNAKDFKERFYNDIVTKVRRIQNYISIPEEDLNRTEVTPTKNVIAPELAKSGAKNVEGVIDKGMLSSNRDTPNSYHGKIDTQDRMAMEDNFNEAMANVDIQLLAGVTIGGEHEQSTALNTNPARETNSQKLFQSTNASLDSEDTVEPDKRNLHVDSSSASKKFKEFFNLSQFPNNSNKENYNVNTTQDRVSSTIDHISIFQGESKLKSNQSKTQHACDTSIKTDVTYIEKNINNRNVADKKTADCQSGTSFRMQNQDKGVYDELLHQPVFCERSSLMNIAEEIMVLKNTQDKLCGKSKSKGVETPAVKEMKLQNASMRTQKSVFIHTTNTKNCSSADSCNKDYDIPYSEEEIVEKTSESKLKVSPHAPNTSSPKSWMSLNLTPIAKTVKKPSIATPSMNCAKERPIASNSNAVLAYGSKVLETPNRDSRLFMLYESTPKISHTARNSWVVPEARLKERKSQLNLSTAGTLTCAKSQMCKSTSKLCFLCTTLTTEQIKNVQRFAKLVDAEFTNIFHPEVTHVIVVTDPENNSIPRTLKYLQAIAHKKWVVSYSWVLDSLKQGILLEEEKYEPIDVFSSEPASRKSRLHQGALFEGFAFLCVGPFEGATVENYEDLVRCTGGHVVQTLDALAASNHQWKFIIIPDVIHDNELIGWYQRTKAVPVLNEWLLECISQYTIISLHSFIRELTSQDLLELGFPLELVEPEESDVTNDASP